MHHISETTFQKLKFRVLQKAITKTSICTISLKPPTSVSSSKELQDDI
uniref:Uncharacterized protein n=1 Tax=Arundo donax TaxID=35708 RepID=A0A0A9AXF9_ARUDO